MNLTEFRERLKSYEVECRLCPHRDHSLVKHIQEAHKLSPGEYKKAFSDAKVVSPVLSELLRRFEREEKDTDDLIVLAKELFPASQWKKELGTLGAKFAVDPTLEAFIPKENPEFILADEMKMVAFAITRGFNAFVEGPTGCGKSEATMQICALMKRPMRRVNMHGDVTAGNFIGKMEANVSGTFYKDGVLPSCMKKGMVLLVDEVDFTPPHIAAVLHPVLEGQRTLFLPDTGETVVAVPGFTVVATGNTGGKGDMRGTYTGVEVLNTAFLDRFPIKVQANYLNQGLELGLLKKHFGQNVPEELLDKMVRLAAEIRVAFTDGKLAVTMSTRKLLDYGVLYQAFGHEEALKVTLFNWLDEDDRALVQEVIKRVGIKS